MQIVLARLIDEPDIALVPGAAPEMIVAFLPAVEDRLVLALVVGAAQGEGILRPDDEGRPMAAGLLEGLLQCMQFYTVSRRGVVMP